MSRTYYQYYTNVTYLTCASCLGWHGRISSDPGSFPNPDDGCERKLLPFDKKELKLYRQKEREMRNRAESELRRRELVGKAREALKDDKEQAFDLFSQSAQIDLYIPEVESLAREEGSILTGDKELRDTLRKLFVRSYSDKFGWPRYERLPEPMRIQREKAGIARINELLA